MRFIIIIFLLCNSMLFAQRIPPRIELGVIEDNAKTFFTKYHIYAEVIFSPTDSLNMKKKVMKIKDDVYYPIEIFEGQKGIIYPELISANKIEKGSLVRVSLLSLTNKESMNIFIKTNKDLKWERWISLQNFTFKKGSFYYDLPKCNIEDDSQLNILIDLNSLKQHELKKNDLHKLFVN